MGTMKTVCAAGRNMNCDNHYGKQFGIIHKD